MPIKRKVTPRMAEANRQNSQKSTGPRTEEGKKQVRYNGVKHGLYGVLSSELLMAVGEDPQEFEHLCEEQGQSFFPFTPAQHMLCEDLALLRWGRLRNQRAQAAQINSSYEELQLNAEELRRQYHRDGMGFNRAEVAEKGMANMPDCPAKFEQIIVSLKLLLEDVKKKDFTDNASHTLLLLYGKQPSLRANFFIGCFRRFRKEKPNKADHAQLHDELIDEQMEWNIKYQFYLRRHVEISMARRNLCFAPREKVWTLLLRQEGYVDRQIERKTRLLWAMQEEDLRRRRDPEWQAIMRQQQEKGPASGAGGQGSATAQTSNVVAQKSKNNGPRTTDQRPMTQDEAEISEQSRQVAETKGSASESTAEDQGSGVGNQGSGNEATAETAGRGAEESTFDPDTGATQPAEEPEKA
jgi:hypothetical protein